MFLVQKKKHVLLRGLRIIHKEIYVKIKKIVYKEFQVNWIKMSDDHESFSLDFLSPVAFIEIGLDVLMEVIVLPIKVSFVNLLLPHSLTVFTSIHDFQQPL